MSDNLWAAYRAASGSKAFKWSPVYIANGSEEYNKFWDFIMTEPLDAFSDDLLDEIAELHGELIDFRSGRHEMEEIW